jgi:hypothetical protein
MLEFLIDNKFVICGGRVFQQTVGISMGTNCANHLICRQVSLLTAPHCQFRGVGQGMKQTYLYVWYPLFQADIPELVVPIRISLIEGCC